MKKSIRLIIAFICLAAAYPAYWIIRAEYRAYKTEVAPGIAQLLQGNQIEWHGLIIHFDNSMLYYREFDDKLDFYPWKIKEIHSALHIRKVEEILSAKGLRNWCLDSDNCTPMACPELDILSPECTSMDRSHDNESFLYTYYPNKKIWFSLTGSKEYFPIFQQIVDSLNHSLGTNTDGARKQ